jgi:hypothetical protein
MLYSTFSWSVKPSSSEARVLTEFQRSAGEDNLNLNIYPMLLDTLLVVLDGETNSSTCKVSLTIP